MTDWKVSCVCVAPEGHVGAVIEDINVKAVDYYSALEKAVHVIVDRITNTSDFEVKDFTISQYGSECEVVVVNTNDAEYVEIYIDFEAEEME